ncbi:hypothetical protein [Saccharothrix coeruleofusca]|uniref:hypothetical protein n=1 Tax=Saccharothrix coeruleofusca TaxID=33919 RepID=UPI001E3A5922|nr:hypothetical protein [Saccharothrix coeruleofusca]MBP2340302.1 hypothetical protein [Saccharothrix coeruleofusca]
MLLTTAATLVLFLPTTTTISSRQPEGEVPGVFVKRHGSPMGGRDYEVWLGQTEDRGHVVRIPSGWGTDFEVRPVEGGLELAFASGGRVFVPERFYTGNR